MAEIVLSPACMFRSTGYLAAFFLVSTSAFAQAPGGSCTLPESYDPSRRPSQKVATPVELGVFVVDIDRVDDAQQSFRVDVFVTAEWTDERLRGAAERSRVQACQFGLDEVWNPQVVLFNRREFGLQLPDVVRVDDAGNVSVLRRFQGALRAPLDLRDFPFDRQRLPITFISLAYSPQQVELRVDDASSSHGLGLTLPGWRVLDRVNEIGVLETVPSEPGRAAEGFVRFDDWFVVERQIGYYVWRAIAPLTFIVLMSWAVFLIDPDNFGVQIALASTSMLTLIAFLFSLNAILPPISYLTRMDFFLFGSLALVFIAFAEAVVTAILARSERRALALRMDRWARWIFPFAFAFLHTAVWTLR